MKTKACFWWVAAIKNGSIRPALFFRKSRRDGTPPHAPRRRRPARGWAWLAAAPLLAGCSFHPELQKIDTVPVKGRITYNGRAPGGRGSISVTRLDGRDLGVENWSVSGCIDADGHYELFTRLGLSHGYAGLFSMKRGAPPGRYGVSIEVWDHDRPGDRPGEPHRRIPRHYGSWTNSRLTLNVVKNPEPRAYDLNLYP